MAGLEGSRLGAYELIERIGSGGMAEVYRANQSTAFGREVAVKVIRQGFSEDGMFRERFLREAQAIAKLSHPNILPLIEFGEEGDILYLVMPYAPGGTLRDLIARVNGPLPLTDTIEIFSQLCDAVQYAHEQGIVHRDIKPQNVLIQRGKHLLLADFGIARDASSDQKLTMTGAGVGTVEYMAPEQAMGKSDARSDLYSLGIVLYQMLTGRVPFAGSTPFEIMMKQAQETLQPARSLNSALPREVDGVLAMALAKDPNRRFQSVGALLRAVQALGEAGRGSQPAAPGDQTDLSTRFAPEMRPTGSGPASSPSLSGRTSAGGSGPATYSTGAGTGYGNSPSRSGIAPQNWSDAPERPRTRTGERDRYSSYGGSQPVGGWSGRPGSGPPAPPYDDNDTFGVERPPRRPTNPYGGSPSRPGTRPPTMPRPEFTPDNTQKRGSPWLLIFAAVLVIAALGAGGLIFLNLHSNKNPGPVTRVTATPTRGVTPTATRPPVPQKPSYAFMRNWQVFVSEHGAAPKQITNIAGVGQPSPSLPSYTVTDFPVSPLLFSPDGRYIAALIAINDAPRDGPIAGNLYIIDTQSNTVATPNAPNSSKLITAYGGDNSVSWLNTHVLLISGDLNTTGIISYDASTATTTVAFTPAGGNIQVGSVVVRGHLAFYSELLPTTDNTTFNLSLQRYDLSNGTDTTLFTLGQDTLFQGPGPQPNGSAPFDISPDGTHVLWHGTQPGGTGDGIWYSKLDQSNLFQLFATVNLGQDAGNLLLQPSPLLSPDGEKALLTTSTAIYTINVDGSGLKTYAYINAQATWQPDSKSITIAQNTNASGTNPVYKTYSCALSTGGCTAFQDNAGPLYWSPV